MKKLFAGALILFVILGAGCGRRKQQPSSTDAPSVPAAQQTAPAQEAAAPVDDGFLENLERPAPPAEPVTRENYEQQLRAIEADLAAEP